MVYIWFIFILYAILFAPGEELRNDPIVQGLLTGQFKNLDALVVTVFIFLGLFPLLFATLLLPKDKNIVPAWPFVLGSMLLGAFSLLPYFFLKKDGNSLPVRIPSWMVTLLNSRWYSMLLFLITISALTYLLNGFSFKAYWLSFKESKLVSVMTIDFLILTWLSYFIIKEQYGIKKYTWFSFFPILGPLMLRWRKLNGRKLK
ncbi:hypothetical protein [Rossellomorea aquimaris]|uniref:hypothetical protein n=1 Tax=Rossellomorea aquimaris TaxID=189382 RepID=UPI0007D0787F|nr:hypothetical protein [Rossellomorea aquimaris]